MTPYSFKDAVRFARQYQLDEYIWHTGIADSGTQAKTLLVTPPAGSFAVPLCLNLTMNRGGTLPQDSVLSLRENATGKIVLPAPPQILSVYGPQMTPEDATRMSVDEGLYYELSNSSGTVGNWFLEIWVGFFSVRAVRSY